MRIGTQIGNSGVWISMGPVGWLVYILVISPIKVAVWLLLLTGWLLLELVIKVCELSMWVYGKVVHQWLS